MRGLAGLAVGTVLVLMPLAGLAGERVDLELVLSVDVSGSVDDAELDLQRHGLVEAFRDPAVVRAIEALPDGLAVAVVVWAGAGQHSLAVPWHRLGAPWTVVAFADTMDAAMASLPWFKGPKTAIGDGLGRSLAELAGNRFDGRGRIDISGDGHNTDGVYPHEVRDRAVAAGVTINGLAVLNEEPFLDEYYRMNVAGGPGSFVMVAADYADFARAMRLKLLHELAPGPVAWHRGGA